MSFEPAADAVITVESLRKAFRIYDRHRHRMMQLLSFGRRRFYREFVALDGISFSVARGQVMGIVGRNGSGKSTLLQLICGTLHPTAGKVTVNGRIAALLELGAGFNPEFTGRENVYMNGALLGLSRVEVDARMDDILAFADIGDFIDQPVRTYSSGMFVRLAFAVIAHVDADILVIDEALAVGDAAFGQKCMRFLRRFRETGAILFVSHDTAAVTGLCDRAIWLHEGGLRAEGSAKEVCERYLGYIAVGDADTEAPPSTPPQAVATIEDAAPASEPATASALAMPVEGWIDGRRQWLNRTSLRNDIEISAFNPDGADFGAGGAVIEDVRLIDERGHPYRWVVGGELATLTVKVRMLAGLEQPIVGFFIKDRLGQNLFGDNTHLVTREAPRPAAAGEILVATFRFPMPFLPRGTYTVAAVVTDGVQDQENYALHHWLHDALHIKSHTSHATAGLVGIPMLEVRLDRAAGEAETGGFFDETHYPLTAQARAEGRDPLEHYLDVGERLGAPPSALFEPDYYARRNADVIRAGIGLLRHFACYGLSEGRHGLSPARRMTIPELAETARPRVLLLSPGATGDGASVLGLAIARELRKRYDVVAVLQRGGPLRAAFDDACSAVIELPDEPGILDEDLDAVARRLAETVRPAYAIANAAETLALIPGLAKAGIGTVALIHGCPAEAGIRRMIDAIPDGACRLLFPARAVAECVLGTDAQTRRQRYAVMPPGIPAAPPFPEEHAGGAGPLRSPVREADLLVVGIGHGGLDGGADLFLMAAAAALRARPDAPLRFVWAGGALDPAIPASGMLAERIARADPGGRIVLADAAPHADEIWRRADVLALPARLDPMPETAARAMAGGIPVVCFERASAVAEILSGDARTGGLVVPYLDVPALAQVFLDLSEHRDRLEAAGAAVRDLAAHTFDMRRYAWEIDRLGREAAG